VLFAVPQAGIRTGVFVLDTPGESNMKVTTSNSTFLLRSIAAVAAAGLSVLVVSQSATAADKKDNGATFDPFTPSANASDKGKEAASDNSQAKGDVQDNEHKKPKTKTKPDKEDGDDNNHGGGNG
jgi:hypothetical protein